MQHQAQETPKTQVAGSYLAVAVQGSPSPWVRTVPVWAVLRLIFQSLSLIHASWLRWTALDLVIWKLTSFESEVRGSLFQVAATPVCVENTKGWDKLPRLSVLYLWHVLLSIKLEDFVCKNEQSSEGVCFSKQESKTSDSLCGCCLCLYCVLPHRFIFALSQSFGLP